MAISYQFDTTSANNDSTLYYRLYLDTLSISNQIYQAGTAPSSKRILPPGFGHAELGGAYYLFAWDTSTEYDIVSVSRNDGGPVTPLPTNAPAAYNVWDFVITRPGFNPAGEGFAVGPARIIIWAPTNAPFLNSNLFNIEIVSITPTTMTIRFISAYAATGGTPSFNYTGNNVWTIVQDLTNIYSPAAALNNAGNNTVFSALSGIEQYNAHPNGISIIGITTQNVIATVNTPSGYKPPVTPPPTSKRIIAIRNIAHYLSIQNPIDYTNSISYPALYSPNLTLYFYPNRDDTNIRSEFNIKTWYPNQDENQVSQIPRIQLTNVGLTFNLTLVGAPAWGNPNNIWLFVKVDDSLHDDPIANSQRTLLRAIRCNPTGPTTATITLPASYFALLNPTQFTVIAGNVWEVGGVWRSIYSNPVDIAFDGQQNEFDFVYLTTDINDILWEFPNNLPANTLSVRGIGKKYLDDLQKYVEIPPWDSLYVVGVYDLTNRGLNIQTALQNLVSNFTNVRANLYYVDAFNSNYLAYSFNAPLANSDIATYTFFSATRPSAGPATVCDDCVVIDTHAHKYSVSARPSVAPKPVPNTLKISNYQNAANHLAAVGVTCWTTHPNLIYNFSFANNTNSSYAFNASASVLFRRIRVCPDNERQYLFVVVALPFPRFVQNNFYLNDFAPFESSYNANFIGFRINLQVIGPQSIVGNTIVYNINTFPFNFRVLNYDPLYYIRLLNDTPTTREYTSAGVTSLKCDGYTFVFALYKDEISPNGMIACIWNRIRTGVCGPGNGVWLGSYKEPVPAFISDYVYHLGVENSKYTDGPLTYVPGADIIRIDKTALPPGRYYIYFRGGMPIPRNHNLFDHSELNPQLNNYSSSDRIRWEKGFWELDSFLVLPPPSDFDLSSVQEDCDYRHLYECDESITLFVQTNDVLDVPAGVLVDYFRDDFNQIKIARVFFPTANLACKFRTNDFCGVEIVDRLPNKTITIFGYFKGRIDDVEIYKSNWQAADYLSKDRFRGSISLVSDTVEEEEYIEAITKRKNSIFRRYIPTYELTLYLPNACFVRRLDFLKKANYWIVESIEEFSIRVYTIPKEISYQRLSNTAKYIAKIKLEEVRYPGEFRYPLR